jgi:imidazolonepropionase-like amidohydrolase
MLTLIENAEVYTPEPQGVRQILLTDGKVAKVGPVDRGAVERLGVECEIVDATGCIVAPGLIDPHIHLLGGSGEGGFRLQSPEFFIGEDVLPLATRNTASILKLKEKGVLEKGRMGDLLVAEKGSLDIVHVFSQGQWMVKDGELEHQESFLEKSDRMIRLTGTKDEEEDDEGTTEQEGEG